MNENEKKVGDSMKSFLAEVLLCQIPAFFEHSRLRVEAFQNHQDCCQFDTNDTLSIIVLHLTKYHVTLMIPDNTSNV